MQSYYTSPSEHLTNLLSTVFDFTGGGDDDGAPSAPLQWSLWTGGGDLRVPSPGVPLRVDEDCSVQLLAKRFGLRLLPGSRVGSLCARVPWRHVFLDSRSRVDVELSDVVLVLGVEGGVDEDDDHDHQRRRREKQRLIAEAEERLLRRGEGGRGGESSLSSADVEKDGSSSSSPAVDGGTGAAGNGTKRSMLRRVLSGVASSIVWRLLSGLHVKIERVRLVLVCRDGVSVGFTVDLFELGNDDVAGQSSSSSSADEGGNTTAASASATDAEADNDGRGPKMPGHVERGSGYTPPIADPSPANGGEGAGSEGKGAPPGRNDGKSGAPLAASAIISKGLRVQGLGAFAMDPRSLWERDQQRSRGHHRHDRRRGRRSLSLHTPAPEPWRSTLAGRYPPDRDDYLLMPGGGELSFRLSPPADGADKAAAASVDGTGTDQEEMATMASSSSSPPPSSAQVALHLALGDVVARCTPSQHRLIHRFASSAVGIRAGRPDHRPTERHAARLWWRYAYRRVVRELRERRGRERATFESTLYASAADRSSSSSMSSIDDRERRRRERYIRLYSSTTRCGAGSGAAGTADFAATVDREGGSGALKEEYAREALLSMEDYLSVQQILLYRTLARSRGGSPGMGNDAVATNAGEGPQEGTGTDGGNPRRRFYNPSEALMRSVRNLGSGAGIKRSSRDAQRRGGEYDDETWLDLTTTGMGTGRRRMTSEEYFDHVAKQIRVHMERDDASTRDGGAAGGGSSWSLFSLQKKENNAPIGADGKTIPITFSAILVLSGISLVLYGDRGSSEPPDGSSRRHGLAVLLHGVHHDPIITVSLNDIRIGVHGDSETCQECDFRLAALEVTGVDGYGMVSRPSPALTSSSSPVSSSPEESPSLAENNADDGGGRAPQVLAKGRIRFLTLGGSTVSALPSSSSSIIHDAGDIIPGRCRVTFTLDFDKLLITADLRTLRAAVAFWSDRGGALYSRYDLLVRPDHRERLLTHASSCQIVMNDDDAVTDILKRRVDLNMRLRLPRGFELLLPSDDRGYRMHTKGGGPPLLLPMGLHLSVRRCEVRSGSMIRLDESPRNYSMDDTGGEHDDKGDPCRSACVDDSTEVGSRSFFDQTSSFNHESSSGRAIRGNQPSSEFVSEGDSAIGIDGDPPLRIRDLISPVSGPSFRHMHASVEEIQLELLDELDGEYVSFRLLRSPVKVSCLSSQCLVPTMDKARQGLVMFISPVLLTLSDHRLHGLKRLQRAFDTIFSKSMAATSTPQDDVSLNDPCTSAPRLAVLAGQMLRKVDVSIDNLNAAVVDDEDGISHLEKEALFQEILSDFVSQTACYKNSAAATATSDGIDVAGGGISCALQLCVDRLVVFGMPVETARHYAWQARNAFLEDVDLIKRAQVGVMAAASTAASNSIRINEPDVASTQAMDMTPTAGDDHCFQTPRNVDHSCSCFSYSGPNGDQDSTTNSMNYGLDIRDDESDGWDADSQEYLDIIDTAMKNAVERVLTSMLQLIHDIQMPVYRELLVIEVGQPRISLVELFYDKRGSFEAHSVVVRNGSGVHFFKAMPGITPATENFSTGLDSGNRNDYESDRVSSRQSSTADISEEVGVHSGDESGSIPYSSSQVENLAAPQDRTGGFRILAVEQDCDEVFGIGGVSMSVLKGGTLSKARRREQQYTIVADAIDFVLCPRDVESGLKTIASLRSIFQQRQEADEINISNSSQESSADALLPVKSFTAKLRTCSILLASDDLAPFASCIFRPLSLDCGTFKDGPHSLRLRMMGDVELRNVTPEGQSYPEVVAPLVPVSADASGNGDKNIRSLFVEYFVHREYWQNAAFLRLNFSRVRVCMLKQFVNEVMEYLLSTEVNFGKLRHLYLGHEIYDFHGNPPPPLQYRVSFSHSDLVLPRDSKSMDAVCLQPDEVIVQNEFVPETWNVSDTAHENHSLNQTVAMASSHGNHDNVATVGGIEGCLQSSSTAPSLSLNFDDVDSHRRLGVTKFIQDDSDSDEFFDCNDEDTMEECEWDQRFEPPSHGSVSSFNKDWIPRITIRAQGVHIFTALGESLVQDFDFAEIRPFVRMTGRAATGAVVYSQNVAKEATPDSTSHRSPDMNNVDDLCGRVWEEVTTNATQFELLSDYAPNLRMKLSNQIRDNQSHLQFPFKFNMRTSQFYLLLSVWYANMQEFPLAFPYEWSMVEEAARRKEIPGDWPEYGTKYWVNFMKNVTSVTKFEIAVELTSLQWQCSFDRDYFAKRPPSFTLCEPEGPSDEAGSEKAVAAISIHASDFLLHVMCNDNGLTRVATGALGLVIKDDREHMDTFLTPLQLGQGGVLPSSSPRADFDWGLDCGRHTLNGKLPLPFQSSVFLTPDHWCLVNIGFDDIAGSMQDLSPVWILLDYFGLYFRDADFGNPFFSAELAKDILKARGGPQCAADMATPRFSPDSKSDNTAGEGEDALNLDIRIWFNRPHLSMPSDASDSKRPCLVIESESGLMYRYKSIGNDFVSQEFCGKDLAVVVLKEYLGIKGRGLREASASDGVKTVVEGLRFAVLYDYNIRNDHTNLSLRIPLDDQDFHDASDMAGIEPKHIETKPLILPPPAVVGPPVRPLSHLGLHVCQITASPDYLSLSYDLLMAFVKGKHAAHSNEMPPVPDKRTTYCVAVHVAGVRALLSDPVLGMHLPIFVLCLPSLTANASLLPNTESFRGSSLVGLDLQVGIDVHFWAEYFNTKLRCWEPMLEPFHCVVLYEASSVRGTGIVFRSECPFHLNVTGALADTLNQAIRAFSLLRLGDLLAKYSGSSDDDGSASSTSPQKEFPALSVNKDGKTKLTYEEDVHTGNGRTVKVIHQDPNCLDMHDRVAYSVLNLTGQRIRMHQTKESNSSDYESRAVLTYLDHHDSVELKFAPTMTKCVDLQTEEVPFDVDSNISSTQGQVGGRSGHSIGIQVCGFSWLHKVPADSLGRKFHELRPQSQIALSKIEQDWRLENALKLLTEVTPFNGGRQITMQSVFKIVNKTSHPLLLALHPDPLHQPAHPGGSGSKPLAPIKEGGEVLSGLFDLGDHASIDYLSSDLCEHVDAGCTYHVPFMLMESALNMSGNHLGSIWFCPDPSTDASQQLFDSLMSPLEDIPHTRDDCKIEFSSRPLELAKLVNESSVMFDMACNDPNSEVEGEEVQVACPVVHNSAGISIPPACFVIEVRRSPLVPSSKQSPRKKHSRSASKDLRSSFFPRSTKKRHETIGDFRGSPFQALGERTEAGLAPDKPSIGLNRGMSFGHRVPSEENGEGSGRRNRKRSKRLNSSRRIVSDEEIRMHCPVSYSMIIHPPIVIENLLPESGTFELMHATRQVVIWWGFLEAGEKRPVYSVGLDAPLLLLINLGYCRTPHGEGALVHDGDFGKSKRKVTGPAGQGTWIPIGKAVKTSKQKAMSTLTTISESPADRGKRKLEEVRDGTPRGDGHHVGNQHLPTQLGSDADKEGSHASVAFSSDGNMLAFGADSIATETTVVDSLGQTLQLNIDNTVGGGGQRRVVVYCPYWIVNTTEHALAYKQESSSLFVSGTVCSSSRDGSRPVDGSSRNHSSMSARNKFHRKSRTFSDGNEHSMKSPSLRCFERGTVFAGTRGALAHNGQGDDYELSPGEISLLTSRDLPLDQLASIAFMFNFHDDSGQKLCMQLSDFSNGNRFVSNWSQGFSLESVGVWQVVNMHCADGRVLEVSVSIGVPPGKLSSYTKIVRVSPRYVLFNDLKRPIRLWQDSSLLHSSYAFSEGARFGGQRSTWREHVPSRETNEMYSPYRYLFGGSPSINDPSYMPPGTTAHRSARYIVTAKPSELAPFFLPDTRADRQLRVDFGSDWNLSASFPADTTGEYALKVSRAIDTTLLKHVATRAAKEYKIVLPPAENPSEWDGELGIWFETDWGQKGIIVKGTKRGKYSYNVTDIHVGDELCYVDNIPVWKMTFADAMKLLKVRLAAAAGLNEELPTRSKRPPVKPSFLRSNTRSSSNVSSAGDTQAKLILTFRTLEERMRRVRSKALKATISNRREPVDVATPTNENGAFTKTRDAAITSRIQSSIYSTNDDAISVEMSLVHQSIFVRLCPFDFDNPPYSIENHSGNRTVYFRQRGCDGHPWTSLSPGQSCAYFWEEPMRPKKLTLRVGSEKVLSARSINPVDSTGDQGNEVYIRRKSNDSTLSEDAGDGKRRRLFPVVKLFNLIENEEQGAYGPNRTVKLEEIGSSETLPFPVKDRLMEGCEGDHLVCRVDTKGETRVLVISDDCNESKDEVVALEEHLQRIATQIEVEERKHSQLCELFQMTKCSVNRHKFAIDQSPGRRGVEENSHVLNCSIGEEKLEQHTMSSGYDLIEGPSGNRMRTASEDTSVRTRNLSDDVGIPVLNERSEAMVPISLAESDGVSEAQMAGIEERIKETMDYPEETCITCRNQVFIEILEAAGLRPADLSGVSNPYCEISLKNRGRKSRSMFSKTQRRKTYFVEKNLCPEWCEQKFVFDVPSEAAEVSRGYSIRIRIRHFEFLGRDTLLGSADIPLHSLRNQKELVGWFPLRNTGRVFQATSADHSRGSVRVRLHWVYSVPALTSYYILLSERRIGELRLNKGKMEEQLTRSKEMKKLAEPDRDVPLPKLTRKQTVSIPARAKTDRTIGLASAIEKSMSTGKWKLRRKPSKGTSATEEASDVRNSMKIARDQYLWSLAFQTCESKRQRRMFQLPELTDSVRESIAESVASEDNRAHGEEAENFELNQSHLYGDQGPANHQKARSWSMDPTAGLPDGSSDKSDLHVGFGLWGKQSDIAQDDVVRTRARTLSDMAFEPRRKLSDMSFSSMIVASPSKYPRLVPPPELSPIVMGSVAASSLEGFDEENDEFFGTPKRSSVLAESGLSTSASRNLEVSCDPTAVSGGTNVPTEEGIAANNMHDLECADHVRILFSKMLLFHEPGAYFHRRHLRHCLRSRQDLGSRTSIAPSSSSLGMKSIGGMKSWNEAIAFLNDKALSQEIHSVFGKQDTTQQNDSCKPVGRRLSLSSETCLSRDGSQDDITSSELEWPEFDGLRQALRPPAAAPSILKQRAKSAASAWTASRISFSKAARTALRSVLTPGGWLTIRPITALNLAETNAGMYVKVKYGSYVLVSNSVDSRVSPTWTKEEDIGRVSSPHNYEETKWSSVSDDESSSLGEGEGDFYSENDLSVGLEHLKTNGTIHLSVMSERDDVLLGTLEIPVGAALACCIETMENNKDRAHRRSNTNMSSDRTKSDDVAKSMYVRWFPLMSPQDSVQIEGDMGLAARPPVSEKESDHEFSRHYAPCIKLALMWEPYAFAKAIENVDRMDGDDSSDQEGHPQRMMSTYILSHVQCVSAALIDSSRAMELLSLCLTDFDLSYSLTKAETRLACALGWIQLDHQLPGAREPVIVSPTPISHPKPTLQMFAVKDNVRSKRTIDTYKVVIVELQELDVRIEESWLFDLWTFLLGLFREREMQKKELGGTTVDVFGHESNEMAFGVTSDANVSKDPIGAIKSVQRGQRRKGAKRLYIEQLNLGGVKVNLSYIKSAQGATISSVSEVDNSVSNLQPNQPIASMDSGDDDTREKSQVKPPVSASSLNGSKELFKRWSEHDREDDFWTEGGGKFAHNLPTLVSAVFPPIQDAPIRLQHKDIHNVFEAVDEIFASLKDYYASETLRQLYRIIGSLEILGNPRIVLNSVMTGVRDFFYEPSRALLHDPKNPSRLGLGVAKGTLSLVSHSFSGLFGFFSKMSATAGDATAKLSLDKRYRKRRAKHAASLAVEKDSIRRPTEQAVAIVVRPAQDVLFGFVGAATGILTVPYRGARKNGAVGLAKGVAVGGIGIVTKPLVGVFDGFAHAFESIHDIAKSVNIIDKKFEPVRKWRLPYNFGINNCLLPFSMEAARTTELLRQFPISAKSGKGGGDSKIVGGDSKDKSPDEFLVLVEVLHMGPGFDIYVVATTSRIVNFKLKRDLSGQVTPTLVWQVDLRSGMSVSSSVENRGHNGVVLHVLERSRGAVEWSGGSATLRIPSQLGPLKGPDARSRKLASTISGRPNSAPTGRSTSGGSTVVPPSLSRWSSLGDASNSLLRATTLSRPPREKAKSKDHVVGGEFQHRSQLARVHNAISCLTGNFDSVIHETGLGPKGSDEGRTSFGYLKFSGENVDRWHMSGSSSSSLSWQGHLTFDRSEYQSLENVPWWQGQSLEYDIAMSTPNIHADFAAGKTPGWLAEARARAFSAPAKSSFTKPPLSLNTEPYDRGRPTGADDQQKFSAVLGLDREGGGGGLNEQQTDGDKSWTGDITSDKIDEEREGDEDEVVEAYKDDGVQETIRVQKHGSRAPEPIEQSTYTGTTVGSGGSDQLAAIQNLPVPTVQAERNGSQMSQNISSVGFDGSTINTRLTKVEMLLEQLLQTQNQLLAATNGPSLGRTISSNESEISNLTAGGPSMVDSSRIDQATIDEGVFKEVEELKKQIILEHENDLEHGEYIASSMNSADSPVMESSPSTHGISENSLQNSPQIVGCRINSREMQMGSEDFLQPMSILMDDNFRSVSSRDTCGDPSNDEYLLIENNGSDYDKVTSPRATGEEEIDEALTGLVKREKKKVLDELKVRWNVIKRKPRIT